MHKASSSIGEVPYCFSRSSVKFQGHRGQKMADFDPHWAFPDSNSQFEFTDGYEMMHKAWSSIWEVPYCFSRSSVKFQGHRGQKMADFDPHWAFPDSNSQFEFTDGYEMMHKAWSSIWEVPYCFSRSSVKFQGHRGQKNGRFWPELGVSGL